MRILLLDHFNRHGGAQEYALELARGLRDLGETPFITRADHPQVAPLAAGLEDTGFRILGDDHRRPGFYRGLARDLSRLRAFVRERGIDLLHCNSVPALAVARLAATGLPAVFTCHDCLASPLRIALVRRLPHHVICVSNEVKKTFPVPRPGRIVEVIPNGLPDLAGSPPRARDGNGPTRVALVGRLVPWKGCELFIAAARKLRTEFPAAEFRLVGEFGDPGYRARVLGLIGDGCVVWHPFTADKAGLYRGLDIVVNASVAPEPFGRTLAEGSMFGLPVVGPDAAGPSEIIEDGVTGLRFRPGDAEALAARLRRLLSDAGMRASLGLRGRRRYLERYSLPAVAAAVRDRVYRPALGLPPAGPHA